MFCQKFWLGAGAPSFGDRGRLTCVLDIKGRGPCPDMNSMSHGRGAGRFITIERTVAMTEFLSRQLFVEQVYRG